MTGDSRLTRILGLFLSAVVVAVVVSFVAVPVVPSRETWRETGSGLETGTGFGFLAGRFAVVLVLFFWVAVVVSPVFFFAVFFVAVLVFFPVAVPAIFFLVVVAIFADDTFADDTFADDTFADGTFLVEDFFFVEAVLLEARARVAFFAVDAPLVESDAAASSPLLDVGYP